MPARMLSSTVAACSSVAPYSGVMSTCAASPASLDSTICALRTPSTAWMSSTAVAHAAGRSSAGTSRVSTRAIIGALRPGPNASDVRSYAVRLGVPGDIVPSEGMASRSCAAGIASRPSRTTATTACRIGCLRTRRTQVRPIVGFSSSGSGALTTGTRAPKTFVPTAPRTAGSRVMATRTATATVAAADSAIAVRNGMLMIDSAASAMSTVRPANTTAEPALPTASPARWARSRNGMVLSCCASSLGSRSLPPMCLTSSVRKRDTMNRA